MTPEERTARQKQLNAWREARRANLSFPHGRNMTQEQIDEQRRLKGEQEKARLALDDLESDSDRPCNASGRISSKAAAFAWFRLWRADVT